MRAWTLRTWAVSVGFAMLGAASLLGCVADDSSSSDGFSGPSGGSSGGTGGLTGSPTPSSQPMLVVVDPNEKMTAAAGEGVAVFVQYASGGHWTVWWTCDTDKTSQDCAFDNVITVSSGTIANAQSQFQDANDALDTGSQRLEATTTTTTGIDQVTFDTPLVAGQAPIITINAQMDAQWSGGFLFFVQNGRINGDYKGALTDPLMLEPKSP
jgi:hypothetical protein